MTRIKSIVTRLGKFLALLALTQTALAASASADEEALPVSCPRLAKVVATGTIAERNEIAKTLAAVPPERVVTACTAELLRSFRDPLRSHLPAPSMQTWSLENQWLAALIRSFVPLSSAEWAPFLDVRVLPESQLADLIVYWTAATESASTVFATLERIKKPAFRNNVLHRSVPWLVRLDAADVTAATRTDAALAHLGFGYLSKDAELASLWQLRGEGAPAAVTDAELRMAKGDLPGAFTAYAEAARSDVRYRLHVGILADRLYRAAKPDAIRLTALGIAYSRCDNGYRVSWEYGGLYPLLSAADAELRAEARLRAREKCVEVPELPDELGDIAVEYAALTKGYDGTRAAWQRKLAYLDRVRGLADELGTHGRLILANQLREWIWKQTEPPAKFKLLAGASHARRLQAAVVGYLAFPPEPEVHVNEK